MDSALDGFYFDPVKKKYFKVLPNHIAPTGVKYSEQAIKDQENNDKVSLGLGCPCALNLIT